MSDNLKNDMVSISTNILWKIQFYTIYNYTDTLFDLKITTSSDPDIEQKIDFLKNTKLSNIVYLERPFNREVQQRL
jgi:hypothetical protein